MDIAKTSAPSLRLSSCLQKATTRCWSYLAAVLLGALLWSLPGTEPTLRTRLAPDNGRHWQVARNTQAAAEKPKQLLLSAATNFQDPYYLWSMVRSFRDVNAEAHIVVLVPKSESNNPNLQRMVQLLHFEVVLYEPHGMTVNQRFRLWAQYLLQREQDGRDYEDVITVDSKDVYFQEDPFQACEVFKHSINNCSFAVAREDQRHTAKSPHSWGGVDQNVVRCYGNAIAQSLIDTNLLNAGFLAGSRKGMMKALQRVTDELERIADPGCLDQVVLNYLLYNRTLIGPSSGPEDDCSIRIEPDSQRCVTTLGLAYSHTAYGSHMWLWRPDYRNYRVVGVYGDTQPVAAVHQYDRDAGHTQYVRERWPWPREGSP